MWLASCHLDRGDPAAALAAAREARRTQREFGPFMFAAMLPALATRALVRLGRGNECEDPTTLVEHARSDDLGYALIAALEAQAEWLHARGDSAGRVQCLDELQRVRTDHGLLQPRCIGTP